MEIQKIKIKSDYQLADIIHDIEKGTLRIPQWQREFVWNKPKVIRLLESIYKEYPIGSFFFWDAAENYHNFYRDIAELNLPKPDKYDKLVFILDGQQRLTSLYVTVKGLTLYNVNYKHICFDLDEAKFLDRKPDNQRYVSVSDLLFDNKSDIYDSLTQERRVSYNDCYRRFTNYPFSAIDVRDKELDEVCDIFERINQGGQRLNLFDLVAASTWTEENDLRKLVKEENEKLKTKGFGEIDNEVFLQALSLIAKGSCTRVVLLQLQAEDIKSCWKDCVETVGLAIDYLRGNFGVVNSQFIPYRSMIAVVAYLFHKNRRRSLNHEQAEHLAQWFWQTTFSERYGASILTLMTEDRKLMDKIADGKELTVKYLFNLDIESLMSIRMYRHSAVKNGVLCLLARRNPRHLKNNSVIPLKDGYYSDFNSSEKHHIFPKSLVQKSHPLAMVHSLPNFCFLPAELNNEISNRKPSRYFEELSSDNPDFEDTLKTHLIRYDDSIRKDDFTSFLASRAALLLEEITAVTGSKISRVITDNVNKAIDRTENSLRDLIDRKMLEKDKNYWKTFVPSDLVGVVRKRAVEHLSKDPSKTMSDLTSRDMLDFCDIMDYLKVILSNWDLFWPVFKSKSELEKRLLNLKEYRNAVKHGRGEVVSFIRKEGEAALEWLSVILKEAEKSGNRKEPSKALTDEEIINHVNSGFVKRMVKEIFQWVERAYPDGSVSVLPSRSGTDRYLKISGKTAIWYYYAKRWVFAELKETTSAEKGVLKEELSTPDSVLDRGNGNVRFHMMNDGDFKVVQEVVAKRAGLKTAAKKED